jgi:hypothetical protein
LAGKEETANAHQWAHLQAAVSISRIDAELAGMELTRHQQGYRAMKAHA